MSIFFSESADDRTTAITYLDVDPIALVRGKSQQAGGLLSQYVNDRPYVANSFLAVAISRAFGQSLAGKSKERQDLADRTLPFEARVVPVSLAGEEAVIEQLFAPLGYDVQLDRQGSGGGRVMYDLRIKGMQRLSDLLSHLYVLIPVLDNAKHYWIDRDEIEKLLAKGERWLAQHPDKELITRRALKPSPRPCQLSIESAC